MVFGAMFMLIFLIVVLVIILIILCIAAILATSGIILLCRSSKRKNDGKPYMFQRIGGIICTGIAIIILAAYPSYEIYTDINEAADIPEDYVNTGITIRQTYGGIIDQDYIAYNGDRYIKMHDLHIHDDLPKLAAYGGTKYVQSELFANILESGTILPRHDYNNYVYKVNNDAGIMLLEFDISLYMRECDIEKFVNYYANITDYNYYIWDGQTQYQLKKEDNAFKFKLIGTPYNRYLTDNLKHLQFYSTDGIYSRQINVSKTSSTDPSAVFTIINGDDEIYFCCRDESLTDELAQILRDDWKIKQ